MNNSRNARKMTAEGSQSQRSSASRVASPLPLHTDANTLQASRTATRKKHSKTRTGCRTCKKRKIKCDEHRPSCQNCVRHSVRCDFNRVSPAPTNGHISSDELPINLMDLELVHNFTCATYSTLTNDPLAQNVWKLSLVRKASRCDYLMRAVLAVSAVHLAQHKLESDEKSYYLSYGYKQHQIASQKAIKVMSDPSPDEAESLWLFSALTMYFALGSPKSHNASLLIGESILPDWIFLFNGCRQIWDIMDETPKTGILAPILKHGGDYWCLINCPEHQEADLLHDLSAKIANDVKDESEQQVYQSTIKRLRPQLSWVLSRDSRDLDIADVFIWIFGADQFMPLLRQKKQEAVAIYAHSCIILNALEHNKWIQGWGDFLLSRAWEMLDEVHRMWIQWPIEVVGWTPPY